MHLLTVYLLSRRAIMAYVHMLHPFRDRTFHQPSFCTCCSLCLPKHFSSIWQHGVACKEGVQCSSLGRGDERGIIHYLHGKPLLCPLLAVWPLGLSFFLCQMGSSFQPSRVPTERNQDPHPPPALAFPVPDPSRLQVSTKEFPEGGRGPEHAVPGASVHAPSPGVREGREPALRSRGAVLPGSCPRPSCRPEPQSLLSTSLVIAPAAQI